MDHRLRPFALTLALPLIVVLAACSSTGAGASSAPSAAASAAAPSASTGGGKYGSGYGDESAAPSAPAAAGGGIALADNALGKILVNGAGLTLYAFTPDTGGTPTCYKDCAASWPPVTGDMAAGAGLDASKLTTVDRTDGTKQLVYGGWPLYLFAGDKAAGDTNGQGLNSKWYVIGADGKLIGQ